jgi:hypothetical protein
VNDANDLAVVSIDLRRFDTRLSNKFGGVHIRKEAFVDLEVYCHDPNDQPIPKIHFAEPPSAVEPGETDASSGDDFDRTEEDFPEMGVEYGGIYLKAENEMRRLRNRVDLTTEDFKTIQDLLEEMDDPLVSITSMTILSMYCTGFQIIPFIPLHMVKETPQLFRILHAYHRARASKSEAWGWWEKRSLVLTV